jgi:hypothetical protein
MLVYAVLLGDIVPASEGTILHKFVTGVVALLGV